MNDIKTLVGQIIQNPESVKSLVTLVKDPKAVARVAGVSEQQWGTLSGICNAASAWLSRVTPAATAVASSGENAPPSSCRIVDPTGKNKIAIVGVLSLVAVTGTIAVLGTVSAAALSNGARKPQP